jgi:GNAT superfamily N-acetyltransferase
LQTPLTDVVIEEVDIRALSDAEIVEANAFENTFAAESHPEDPPTPVEITRASLRNLPDFVVIRMFYVRTTAGELIASGNATWVTNDENAHLVQAGIGVLPDHRRRGIATMLLRKIVDVTEAEGRTTIMGGTTERVPSGEAFAQRVGADAAMRAHTNRLLLADVSRDLIARWIEEGPSRASGYSLVVIDGPYPDDIIEAVVDVQEVMNTAPREDLDMEDWHWTVEQIRESEKSVFAEGGERWFIAARHDSSGVLAGFTELFYNRNSRPETAWQGGTGVRPEHRGHALGKWLKAVNIQRVLDEWREVVDIRTGNADSNDAMLGINTQLGFKPYHSEIGWQISLEKAKAYVDSR